MFMTNNNKKKNNYKNPLECFQTPPRYLVSVLWTEDATYCIVYEGESNESTYNHLSTHPDIISVNTLIRIPSGMGLSLLCFFHAH